MKKTVLIIALALLSPIDGPAFRSKVRKSLPAVSPVLPTFTTVTLAVTTAWLAQSLRHFFIQPAYR
jgi:hypothetical protein